MIHLDLIHVKFVDQGHRSNFKVAGRKCSFFDWKWKTETGKTSSDKSRLEL